MAAKSIRTLYLLLHLFENQYKYPLAFLNNNNNNNIFIHTCYNCIEQYIPINNNILRIIKHVMLNI